MESSGRSGPICHIKPLSFVYIRVCKCCNVSEEEINDRVIAGGNSLLFLACTQRGEQPFCNMWTYNS